MFGHNEVTGQKFFREAPEARAGKLLVTSIFHTIQGEGPFAGSPAVFVRLAKCQLQCSFCDTYFDTGDWMSAAEIAQAARAACGDLLVPDLLVVTGGEPTLQSDALTRHLRELVGGDLFTDAQIETNGLLPARVVGTDNVAFVVSPKCAERDGRPTHYLRPHPQTLQIARCLKFVVSGDPDSLYHTVPEWAHNWRLDTGWDVFVSPMAEYNYVPEQTRELYEARRGPTIADRTRAEKISFWEPGLLDLEKCRRNYEYAARYALEHNLRLTLQMQLFASLP